MDIPTITSTTTAEELEALYNAILKDEEQGIGLYVITKKTIASHPATPIAVLIDMHKRFTQPQIKLALLENENLPRSVVLAYAADKHPEVKKAATMRLKNKTSSGPSAKSMVVGGGNAAIKGNSTAHKSQQLYRRKGG
jgi:hypothetical protein